MPAFCQQNDTILDYFQENIVHTSDSPETAAIELVRFFKPEEIYEYKQATFDYLYANDEY